MHRLRHNPRYNGLVDFGPAPEGATCTALVAHRGVSSAKLAHHQDVDHKLESRAAMRRTPIPPTTKVAGVKGA